MRQLRAFNFQQWLHEHRHLLKPPVGNKQIWEDADLMVTVLGSNKRTDFHDDPVEEFFYQLEGDMVIKIIDRGQAYDVPLRPGDIFLMPPHVRHSPQRPILNSIGFVVEPKRPPGELDAFEWYCFSCNGLVHRVEVTLRDIVRDLPPLFEAFFQSHELRTCKACSTLHPGPTPPPGWVSI